MKLTDEQILYGTNTEENIVNIYIDKNDVTLFKRVDNKVVKEEYTHTPFIWATEEYQLPPTIQQFECKELSANKNLYKKIYYIHDNYDEVSSQQRMIRQAKPPDYVPEIITHKPMLQYQIHTGKTLFKGMTLDTVKIFSFDLETDGLQQEQVFNFKSKKKDTVFTCGITMCAWACNDGSKGIIKGSEEEIIKQLFKLIKKLDPDVVTTFNGFGFDWNVIWYKCIKYGIKTNIGRVGSKQMTKYSTQIKVGDNDNMDIDMYKIPGRFNIDLLPLLKKYDAVKRKLSGYGLKTAMKELELERPDRVHINGDDIQSIYESDPEKVEAYCIDDAVDNIDLGNLLLPVYFALSQMLPMQFDDVCYTGMTTLWNNIMARGYYHYEHALPVPCEREGFKGASVGANVRGFFMNVFNFDVASLYPSIILSNSISPPNDEIGLFLRFMKLVTTRRLEAKGKEKTTSTPSDKRVWGGINDGLKIFINSGYGVLSNAFFYFNYNKGAEFVTGEGRRILAIMIEALEKSGFMITNYDTDGVYGSLIDFQKWNDIIGSKHGILIPEFIS